MDLKQLNTGLDRVFNIDKHRIVFWYDAEADFEPELSSVNLDDVSLVNMRKESAFSIKLKLELEDLQGRYLLYFPFPELDYKHNWLLDIQLYSHSFYADKPSMVLQELGLTHSALRAHLIQRERFLASKQRIKSLKSFISSESTESDIDLAMIAVVVGADQADIASIIYAMSEKFSKLENVSLSSSLPQLEQLTKFNLLPYFLELLQIKLGCLPLPMELDGEVEFSFGRLLSKLLVTDFISNLDETPSWASDYVLPSVNAIASAKALLSGWRDSHKYYSTYDAISRLVEDELTISSKLNSYSLQQLSNVETFSCVEQEIIIDLIHAVPEVSLEELIDLAKLVSNRQDKHWASRHHDDSIRKKYFSTYRALSSAIELFKLRKQYATGFHFNSFEAMYQAYVSELHLFDTHYRHYCHATLFASVDSLKSLDKAVESCYSYWYLDNLSKNWGDKLEAEERLSNWQIPDVPNQQYFYHKFVKPVISDKKSKRIVVIISDAFRYEAAAELKDRLNEKRYCEANLSNQLGVLPSYTALGMAALLPHDQLEYKEGSDEVLVDGLSTAGTIARNKILAQYGGMAVTADELKKWTKDSGREAIKGKQLVYIYHNIIDARGDTASTESETFAAVEDAITDLTNLVRKILLTLNTSTVLVTADHGFIFQQEKLSLEDKTKITDKPNDVIKSKKRYIIANKNLKDSDQVWSGNIADTSGTSCRSRFWIPKGMSRFHFVSGARFVHGGAMPQEIVIPVLEAKARRGKKAAERTKQKVGVISAKSSLKMVNAMQSFDFIQTDTVTEKYQASTVLIGIFDAENLVSNEERITFESQSDSMTERFKVANLSLLGNDFDRKKEYSLVIKDAETRADLGRYRIVIDLAFRDFS